jgi:hypothetical protein
MKTQDETKQMQFRLPKEMANKYKVYLSYIEGITMQDDLSEYVKKRVDELEIEVLLKAKEKK